MVTIKLLALAASASPDADPRMLAMIQASVLRTDQISVFQIWQALGKVELQRAVFDKSRGFEKRFLLSNPIESVADVGPAAIKRSRVSGSCLPSRMLPEHIYCHSEY